MCFQLRLAPDMLLTTNKANISATNLYLFCAVLFMSCHLWLSLVLFLFCFFYYIFIFFSFNIFHRSRLCGFPGLWHDFCVQICPHAFSFESIFDFGLNSWPNQLIPGDIFWVRDDCVLSFALFWGGMTPLHFWLIVAPPPNLRTMYYLHSSGHCHIVGCSSTLTALLAPVLLSRLLSPLTGFTSS